MSLPGSRSLASRLQATLRNSIGHITESMPKRHTLRKINGATEDGRSIPAARPHAAMAPRDFGIERMLASVDDPTLSTPPAQRSFANGLAGPHSSPPLITSAAPRTFRKAASGSGPAEAM